MPAIAHESLVIHLTQDLMAAAPLKNWASRQGMTYCMFPRFEQLQEWHSEARIELLAIDLQATGIDWAFLASWIEAHRRSQRLGRVIGYAQHVESELIENARQQEFGEIMTRGQFIRWIASSAQMVGNQKPLGDPP